MIVVGIDTGKRGGVAILSERKVKLINTPEEPIGMADIIGSVTNSAYIEHEDLFVYIENVHAFPTDTRSSAFKFGMNYGMWWGILASYKITPVKVHPRNWMKEYTPLPKEKLPRKRELKERGQRMYPDVKVTLRTSDALLIARYGLITEKEKENERDT